MHQPYSIRFKHIADFRIEYRFYLIEEGGRQNLPLQGYRSDFWYDKEDDAHIGMVFMIWPEFENELGEIILDDKTFVSPKGTARMWIIDEKRRAYHRDNIKVDMNGYLMEGSRRIAECRVIELLGLGSNPIEI
jgi:hypothetical protein